jgi:rRNA-processing protein FCF1
MTEAEQCSCVIDTGGLHELANASGNLRTILLDHLKKGIIAVPTCVWQEFNELYEDEAAQLSAYVGNKIIMSKAVYVGAARIADKLNSGFPGGAYDNHSDLYAASIAINKGYRVLTTSIQVKEYTEMECEASDLATWVAELDAGQ